MLRNKSKFTCLAVCLSVCLSVCTSVCMSVYLPACLPICLSVCLTVCLSVCLFACLSVCLSVWLTACSRDRLQPDKPLGLHADFIPFLPLSVFLSVSVSVCLSVLSVCLSVWLSVRLQSWTKVVETLSEKDPFGSTSLILTFRPPLPLSMLQPGESVHGAYYNIENGERGFGYQQKRCFLKLRKDADRKRLFCSNVSTLLSMIVTTTLPSLFVFLFIHSWQLLKHRFIEPADNSKQRFFPPYPLDVHIP